MSMHRPLLTLISTDKYGAKALWVEKAPWRQAHKCSLVLMSTVGTIAPCSWVLMATYKCSWMRKNIYEHIRTWHHDHSWAVISTHGHSWALISTHEHSWGVQSAEESLMRTQEYSGALMNSFKYVALVPWVLMSAVEAYCKSANACFWVVMSVFGTLAPCSWVHMVDDGCSWHLWLLMSALEPS